MGQRIFLIVRSTIYITGFMLLWLWLFPSWLALHTSMGLPARAPLRFLGLIPLIAGAIIAAYCFVHFITAGKGTPAPFDAPRLLVVSGPYRWVRNPMYLGAGLFLIGCAILFSELSLVLLWYAVAIVAAVNLFILLYEEPTLRRQFNGSYEDYCRHVRRWIPRGTPWVPQRQTSAR